MENCEKASFYSSRLKKIENYAQNRELFTTHRSQFWLVKPMFEGRIDRK